MSAGNFTLYNGAAASLLEGGINLAGANLQVVLLTSAYTPSRAHAAYSDISGSEVSGAAGTGYTTGGQALSGNAIAAGASGGAIMTASPVTWNNATMAPAYVAVIEKAGTTLAATDKLIGFAQLASVSVAGANFTLDWPETGLIVIP